MIKDLLNKIKYKQIDEVICGGSNGSIILLLIGNQEYSLSVYCAWRLEHKDKVITGWNETNDHETGDLTKNIIRLTRTKIINIELTKFYDLILKFDNNFTLRIFCDLTPNLSDEYSENWIIADKIDNKVYVITNKFEIKEHEYSRKLKSNKDLNDCIIK